MSDTQSLKVATRLVGAGENTEISKGYVNIPPFNGSTILFPSIQKMEEVSLSQQAGLDEALSYGSDGGPTHQAFYKAMNELEAGAGTWAYSTGLAGCVVPFFALVKTGDHALVADSVYGPTREFCEKILTGLGVEVQFYDPLLGASIETLIKANTKVIYMESPGSHSFEMQDVPAIAQVAQKHNVWTMADNTWATGLNFKPLEHGVDVVIEAATKYICGHSDALMATVTCNAKAWPLVLATSRIFGQYASADTVYLATRGLHTLKVRLDAVARHTHHVVQWLSQRDEVAKILWPAYEKDPGYEIFKRDYKGASGLFAFEFKPEYSPEQIDKFIDSLSLFGLGYSWGGCKSLLIKSYGKRSESQAEFERMVRVYVGLEDPEDLEHDLQQAFEKMKKSDTGSGGFLSKWFRTKFSGTKAD